MMELGRLSEGDVFADRYEVLSRLGAGGAGSVYAARQLATNRRVALKLLHASVGESVEMRARFETEARTPATIRSPHIVEVLDAGVDAKTEAPYLVMELLEGETLAKRVAREGHVAPAQVVAILWQVASALDRAHAQGIVHRDIKPDNIYLARLETKTIVKVLDFGIAKTDEGSQTLTGAILGTPLYMSPEQVEARGTTRLVDIWALGLVAFHALVGITYWSADGVANLLRQIIGGPKDKAVTRAAKAGVTLPGAFDPWFERCVAHDPDDRFQSAGEALTALAAVFGVGYDVAIDAPPNAVTFGLSEGGARDKAPKGSLAYSQARSRALEMTGTMSKGMRSVERNTARSSTREAVDVDAPSTPTVGAVAAAGPSPAPPVPRQVVAGPLPPVVVVPMPGGASAWSDLASVLPAGLAAHGDAIGAFLRALFDGFEPVEEGIVRLTGPRIEGGAARDFFAVFMGEGDRGDRTMLTATFLGYVDPLASHLERLDASRRKVVLAIVDSLELGGGVHHKIFEFNERFAAMVLPLHVGDLAGAADEAGAMELFRSRLSDFHVFPDVFGAGGRTAASRFGTRATINDLTSMLRRGSPFVVAYGPPGSGKTSLVETVAGELAHKNFVKVRCSLGTPSVAALVQRIELALRGEAPARQDDARASSIGERLTRALDAARGGPRGVVLVLDDADWPVRALVDPATDEEERARVHEFWLALSDCVDAGKLGVVVTGTSAFLLLKTPHRGWLNPIANQARRVELQPLTFADLRKMMTDLGAQVNARFEDGAIDEVYTQSGGNIHVVRVLCRSVVVPKRSSSQVTPLHEIAVSRGEVRAAADALALTPDTFTDTMIAALDEPERLVLKVVADARPRAVAQIWRALEGRCMPTSCSDALERLLKMRFIEWRGGRARVAIPLLERWARVQLEPIAREAARIRSARRGYAAFGASVSAILLAGYFVWTAEHSQKWNTTACEYLAAYPSRAAPEVPFVLRVVRQCTAPETVSIGLYPGKDTSVRFEAGLVGGVAGAPAVASSAIGAGATVHAASSSVYMLARKDDKGNDVPWDNDQVRVTFQDMNGAAFVVDVRPMASPTQITIQKDWIGNLSTFVKALLAVASAVPALVGLFAAFHEQMRSAFRRLGGERDKT